MERDAKWYYQAYNFMTKFKNYELFCSSYLDCFYKHYRLKCIKTNTWLGPEIVYTGNGEYRFSHIDSFPS